jgi:1-acyl-sn-glycerol-3-phosphate acyltransferase
VIEIVYAVLRWITGISLHWFYRDIRVIGKERIPLAGPLLIAVNHQNALVDSLITGWIVPRHITMTAKATLADNPFIAALFKILNVVPLRRTSDEVRNSNGLPTDRSRNAGAFREILHVLERHGAVLIFPEGKSHNQMGLEPLKTGLARLALRARDESGIAHLKILPLGLVFEEKGTPGTAVCAHVGTVIEMDLWPGSNYAGLTQEIADRLRAVAEESGLALEQPARGNGQRNPLLKRLIVAAAWWGRLTHQIPVRMARNLAVRHSTDADEPAMFTIVFGVGLVLVTYAIHLTILGVIVHSFWILGLYLIGLLMGAYWAAFEQHPRHH